MSIKDYKFVDDPRFAIRSIKNYIVQNNFIKNKKINTRTTHDLPFL